jgi:hypothetical protein
MGLPIGFAAIQVIILLAFFRYSTPIELVKNGD